MTGDTPYNDTLKDHYHHPRNRSDPSDAQVVRRGRNPRCGDDLEIGVDFDGDTLSRVRFRGRGCSICIVSASMMTEAVTGHSREEARALSTFMHEWFAGQAVADDEAPGPLRPLSLVRKFPARRRCVLLAWEALDETLATDSGA